MSVRVKETTFPEWLLELDRHGSTNDPILYKGKSTTPQDLSYEFEFGDKITGVKITYYGGRKLRKIKGTCGGMMRERARNYPYRPIRLTFIERIAQLGRY